MAERTMKRFVLCLYCGAMLSFGCASTAIQMQSAADLMESISISHHDWVLVTVLMPNRPPQAICMSDSALERAIGAEHSLSDPSYWQSMSNIVYEAVHSGFHFSKPAAMEKIPPPCDPNHLDAMRKALSKYTNQELIKHDFSSDPLNLELPPDFPEKIDQRVFPQVLLERGLRPFLECFSGSFTITNSKGHNNRIHGIGEELAKP